MVERAHTTPLVASLSQPYSSSLFQKIQYFELIFFYNAMQSS